MTILIRRMTNSVESRKKYHNPSYPTGSVESRKNVMEYPFIINRLQRHKSPILEGCRPQYRDKKVNLVWMK